MREALNISSPTVVIEGIATDIFEHIDNIPQEKGTKTVLYSGGVNKKVRNNVIEATKEIGLVLKYQFEKIPDPEMLETALIKEIQKKQC